MIKLKHKDIETSQYPTEEIMQIYNEYEERKRIRKIKVSLLFKDEQHKETRK